MLCPEHTGQWQGQLSSRRLNTVQTERRLENPQSSWSLLSFYIFPIMIGISNSKQCPLQTAHTRAFLQRAQTDHLMFTPWPSSNVEWETGCSASLTELIWSSLRTSDDLTTRILSHGSVWILLLVNKFLGRACCKIAIRVIKSVLLCSASRRWANYQGCAG